MDSKINWIILVLFSPFDKKYQRENKVPDLASLPPCHQVFLLHALRSNYVAYMWRKSVPPIVALPDETDNGWLATGEINWIDEVFPEEIKRILCDGSDQEDINEECEESTLSEEEFYGSDIESDADENDFLP